MVVLKPQKCIMHAHTLAFKQNILHLWHENDSPGSVIKRETDFHALT